MLKTALPLPLSLAPAPNPLARLVALRRVEVIAQGGVMLLAVAWLRIPLEIGPMIAATGALGLLNLATQWRLDRGWPVTHNELFVHLALDACTLAILLYFAGGSANPFISLFLLAPTLAAALLPARYAWAMAGLTLVIYTLLMFWNLPLPAPQGDLAQLDSLLARATGTPPEHAGHMSGFALHVLGMWLNFVISVGVVAFFLTRMATALKCREQELAAAREAALRHEQILSLGTLAAGAAHKLGTPLATMAVVIRELELGHGDPTEQKEDLRLLRQQVDLCKQTISQILASAGQARDESLLSVPLDAYLNELLDEWRLIRPCVPLCVKLEGTPPGPLIAADRTLEQAILNLLDNAADAHGASPEDIRFTAQWDTDTCRIEILDSGTGIDRAAARQIGQPFFSTKRNAAQGVGGLGIGFFLTNATVERLGGKVELFNRDRLGGQRQGQQAGACTRLTLPLARLKALKDD
jgi:two-component system, sensor histidine kinase RegB